MIITGQHYQNAYVTRDIEAALSRFRETAQIRREMQVQVSHPCTVYGERGEMENKLAFVWVEDLQYEFIEPVGGMCELYSDALPAGDGSHFHHICMRVADWESFRREARSGPLPIVLEGGGDDLRYLYLDARGSLGHYLEYTWMTDERWTQLGGR